MLANVHSILAYDVPRTKDVGLSTKFRGSMLGERRRPMPVNRLRRCPNTDTSLGLLYTLHPMLFQC